MSHSLFITNKNTSYLLIALIGIFLVSTFLSETTLAFNCNQYECPPGYDYCTCRGFTCYCSKKPQLKANMIEKKVPVPLNARRCGTEVCPSNCYCNGYEFECVCPKKPSLWNSYDSNEEMETEADEVFDAMFDEEEE